MPVSFFSKSSAAQVWKSVTGVSAAGSKRGRGKGLGRAVVKDYNRGQVIGEGRRRLVLAGLNTQTFSARKFNEIQDLGPNTEFIDKLDQVRKQLETYRRFREAPIDRGWSGRRSPGRHAGPPSDHDETSFDGFQSTVLMLRSMNVMSGIFGRQRIMQALVVVGNERGLAGIATASGKDGRACVRHARNIAGQNLMYMPRWDNHTVLHDFHSKYYHTTVFVERKPKGYGLNCSRAVKAICQHVGITDLFATVQGVRNPINIAKAFFVGLINQKQYQEMADEKRLHLVDLREECFNLPRVLASPSDPSRLLKEEEIRIEDENLDFTFYINEGRIRSVKPPFRDSWINGPTWYKHLDRVDLSKNREQTKLQLAAKYGNTEVLDVFPYFKTNAKAFNKVSD